MCGEKRHCYSINCVMQLSIIIILSILIPQHRPSTSNTAVLMAITVTDMDNNIRRMDDLIVDFSDFSYRKQSASSSRFKTKLKLKVRFSETSRLYVITRATPEEAPRVWSSSKEIADIKCRFAITVRKTWQMMDDTEVRILDYLFVSATSTHIG